jgi:hypothetical protein
MAVRCVDIRSAGSFAACLLLLLLDLAGCGGGSGNSSGNQQSTGSTTNPVPSLISITPSSTAAGSNGATITATGSNFVSSSVVEWSNSALPTSYLSSTKITAQVSAADLQTQGTVTVTVSNPAPGGGMSTGLNFTVGPPAAPQVTVVNVIANDLAWDPVNQVIYVSLPGTDPSNGNTIQILDPATGTLGEAVPDSDEPNLLAVSQTSKYLYVSQNGASTVQVMTLPGLANGLTIQLGSGQFGPFYAMDLQASPVSDESVAVVRATPGFVPEEEGGVVIYDNGTALPDVLCGSSQTSCANSSSATDLFDSIQWSSDGTDMYAANYESTGYDFYTIPVSSSGFGTVTDYPGLLLNFFANLAPSRIHYDSTTGYVYDDDGYVVNPKNGTVVGQFGAYGAMIPDGTLGLAYFLVQPGQGPGLSVTLESFDIKTLAPVGTLNIPNVVGTASNLIRWGTNGLAFITYQASTPPTGAIYVLSGSFVTGSLKRTVRPQEDLRSTQIGERASGAAHSTNTTGFSPR